MRPFRLGLSLLGYITGRPILTAILKRSLFAGGARRWSQLTAASRSRPTATPRQRQGPLRAMRGKRPLTVAARFIRHTASTHCLPRLGTLCLCSLPHAVTSRPAPPDLTVATSKSFWNGLLLKQCTGHFSHQQFVYTTTVNSSSKEEKKNAHTSLITH